jgi:hypothetical protein
MRRLIAGLVLAAVLGLASHAVKGRALRARETWPDYEEYVLLPPPRAARVLSLGYRELLADITWARALVYYGSSHVGESQFVYLDKFIENILALDPKFYRVYRWAAYAVTFKANRATQDEYLASVRYLERGIREFPDRYELFWLLGLRYWLDLRPDDPAEQRRNRERAADLIEQAMRKPDAPPTLPTLAATMRTKLGQHARARRELLEMLLTTENKRARERLLTRYGSLVESDREVEDARAAATEFEEEWKQNLPYAPAGMHVLLGPPPSRVIDFDELANERDLFDVQSEPEHEPEPEPEPEPTPK